MPKEEEHKQITTLEYNKLRATNVGSRSLQDNSLYVLNDDKFILKELTFTPALYKIIDEIIVNAIDRNVNFPKMVNLIKIKFDKETGKIEVQNNGPPMPVKKTTNINGDRMYTPQLICSEFNSGSNFDDDAGRITGGANGLGIKLTNAYSELLEIEIVNTKDNLYYKQRFKDRLEIIEGPKIKKLSDITKNGKAINHKDFTKITFIPSYHALGYKKKSVKNPTGYDIKYADALDKIIEIRAHHAAIYCSKGTKVYYNNKLIKFNSDKIMEKFELVSPLNSFETYAYMYLPNPEYGFWYNQMKLSFNLPSGEKSKPFKWDVGIGISDGKFRQVSIINGINVYNGGNHMKYIQKQLIDNLKPRVEKTLKSIGNKSKKKELKFNKNWVINNLFIFVKGAIVNPEFPAQVKDSIGDPVARFETLEFKKKHYDELWTLLEPHVMSQFLDKYKDKNINKVSRGMVSVPKSQDAKFAGSKKKAMDTTLIICEGDSARGTVHEGITHKKTNLDYNYYGTFNIQGVAINARKECKEVDDIINNAKVLIRSAKLQNNERLNSLVKIVGLDFNKTYKTKEEFNTLRYGRIVVAVDQDIDGTGHIFGLLINFFTLFWPNLVRRGYVYRFNTPLVRAYPKNKNKLVEEFFLINDYKKWIDKKFEGDDDKMSKLYTIKYYKGLGSHKRTEIPQLFKSFEDRLYRYTLDEEAETNLEKFYGKETKFRKQILSTPHEEFEGGVEEVDITTLLHTDVKEFQRDNIIRKLPHLIDGMVPSRRKALYTATLVFGTTKGTNKEKKVNAFVNETSSKTHYHHGEASLASTITKMAQDFPGAKNLPLLRPEGQFGTRAEGGKDYASPRYTFTKLNQRLCYSMFPKSDYFLLPYQFDDGDRCEPTYFVPVLPLSILENMEIPGTGWKAKVWARDVWEVYDNVLNMVKGKTKKSEPLSIWLNNNSGDIREYEGKLYSVGTYKYDKYENAIIVTELPLRVFSNAYKGDYSDPKGKALCQRQEFRCAPYDETNEESVKITFYLKDDDTYNYIQNHYKTNDVFDGVEEFMKLKIPITSNLNMIDEEGNVLELRKYSSVINRWFNVRKDLYTKRIDRMILLTKLRIKYLKNIIKFTKNHHSYDITPKTKREVADSILEKAGFDTFNHTLLMNPKYTEVSELESLIINNIDANTSYDYILNLRYSDLIKEACKKRETKLEEEEKALEELLEDCEETGKKFKGQKTWLKELKELKQVIKDGLKLGWDYGEDKAKFRD